MEGGELVNSSKRDQAISFFANHSGNDTWGSRQNRHVYEGSKNAGHGGEDDGQREVEVNSRIGKFSLIKKMTKKGWNINTMGAISGEWDHEMLKKDTNTAARLIDNEKVGLVDIPIRMDREVALRVKPSPIWKKRIGSEHQRTSVHEREKLSESKKREVDITHEQFFRKKGRDVIEVDQEGDDNRSKAGGSFNLSAGDGEFQPCRDQ
ncbi:hypothetical protein DITRI_Ditri01bG0124700 [Diplodiscus trichospermus]